MHLLQPSSGWLSAPLAAARHAPQRRAHLAVAHGASMWLAWRQTAQLASGWRSLLKDGANLGGLTFDDFDASHAEATPLTPHNVGRAVLAGCVSRLLGGHCRGLNAMRSGFVRHEECVLPPRARRRPPRASDPSHGARPSARTGHGHPLARSLPAHRVWVRLVQLWHHVRVWCGVHSLQVQLAALPTHVLTTMLKGRLTLSIDDLLECFALPSSSDAEAAAAGFDVVGSAVPSLFEAVLRDGAAFGEARRLQLLTWCTGLTALPVGGLRENKIRLRLYGPDIDDHTLPETHTCTREVCACSCWHSTLARRPTTCIQGLAAAATPVRVAAALGSREDVGPAPLAT